MSDEEREHRAEEGRAAFNVLANGIRELGVAMASLAASNARLSAQIELQSKHQVLVASLLQDLVTVTQRSWQFEASLQEQIGALVRALAHQGAPMPVLPPRVRATVPVDPIGGLGRSVLSGVKNGILGGSRPPGR